ncbi:MAG: chloride channel protein [Myxococcota bacterium]
MRRRGRPQGAPRLRYPAPRRFRDIAHLGIRKLRTDGYLFMVSVAILIGLAGAAGAIVFRILIRVFGGAFFRGSAGIAEFLDAGFFADPRDPLDIARTLGPLVLLAIPAVGGLIAGVLVTFFAPEARGHGVPEVMEAVAVRGGRIRRRVVAVKTLASAISIGSGGSVGREGPIVQIGSSIASWLGQVLRVTPRQMRTLVGCGAGAGIAATFNAPIAGALFAVEIVIGDFAVSQFSPIVISSVVATVASRYFLGNHPAFQVPDYELVSPFELGPYMIAGAIAGLIGVAFIRALALAEDSFEAIRIPEATKAGVGGACVGMIGIAAPQVLGVGYESIGAMLTGGLPVFTLALIVVAKLAATSLTIGSGGSGGIFAPSLFMGAALGGLLGTPLGDLFPGMVGSPGAYALVTMGAMVAATTHAPITSIIMIFELTQSIEIIPPLMAACVISTLVSTFLFRESIYTHKLSRRGIDLSRDEDPNVLKSLLVRDILDRDPEVVDASARFDEVIELIVSSDHSELFVVNERKELVGTIYLRQVRRLLREQEELRSIAVASDMVEERVVLSEDEDLDAAMQLFSRGVSDEIAVVRRGRPLELAGSIHERDVLAAYNREILRRDLTGGVSSWIQRSSEERQVDLGGGFVLEESLAPASFVGRTLGELQLRQRGGVQVVLIRGPGRNGSVRVPTADDRICEGDQLVLAGPRDAVERMRRS